MRTLISLFLTLLAAAQPLAAWGRRGHQLVAQLAFMDLPEGPRAWLEGAETVLVEHSSDPDDWKADRLEGPRHFLDMDRYGDHVPTLISEARAQLGPRIFQRAGQLPWVVQDRVQELARAFRSRDRQQIAFQTSILSHYVGDLHVPLHTVSNYDGRATGQKGVHSRWESKLLDRLDGSPSVRPAAMAPNLLMAPWKWIQESTALVPQLLADDQLAAAGDGAYRAAYWARFARSQGPVALEQLSRAGQHTAQLVLLAWTLAGEPAPDGPR